MDYLSAKNELQQQPPKLSLTLMALEGVVLLTVAALLLSLAS